MQNVLEIRESIYDFFQASSACQSYFFDAANEEIYAQYYTGMYLLQDTTESLCAHRESGFSANPFRAYIEIWGVLQAVYIQQDAFAELHLAAVGVPLEVGHLRAWRVIRDLRNECAGHPANRSGGKVRTFIGRSFGSYSNFAYEKWSAPGSIEHPRVDLGELLDEYADELAGEMRLVLNRMKELWPSDA